MILTACLTAAPLQYPPKPKEQPPKEIAVLREDDEEADKLCATKPTDQKRAHARKTCFAHAKVSAKRYKRRGNRNH